MGRSALPNGAAWSRHHKVKYRINCTCTVWVDHYARSSESNINVYHFLNPIILNCPKHRFLSLLCLNDPFKLLADFGNAAWQGAFALVDRPFFTRVWVVQEVVLSSSLRIRCGEFEISGDDFCDALQVISGIASFPPSLDLMKDFNSALQLANLRWSTMAGTTQNFLHLAHRLSRWDCTDHRDRLNALVSVAFKGNPSLWFSPNYRTDVEGVY
jgi:hypothetical protein